MKKKLTIYEVTKNYIYPNMQVATPDDVAKTFSVVNIKGIKCVFESDESGMMLYTAPEPISIIRSRYEVDSSLNDEDAIAVIEDILNAPLPDPEPTAEERIAAAMEFQNLLTM